MRVISWGRLRDYAALPERGDALEPLAAWYKVVEAADWTCFADVRAVYATASAVGNCVVFNIGGNKHRLVTRILYPSHCVYILRVMAHEEYDDQAAWQEACGCHSPPPARPTARTRAKPRTRGRRR